VAGETMLKAAPDIRPVDLLGDMLP
jgi:hypothetical protein